MEALFAAVCDFSQMRESGVLIGGFLPIFIMNRVALK
jgi:hypothetical protein